MSVIGIDLGTTNSCVAVWRNNKVEVIANDLGNRITPSWVAFTDEERIFGEPAVIQMIRNPGNTVFDVKRLIGREFEDPVVQEDMKLWPFSVVDVGGKPRIQVEYLNETKKFAPEEISAMVLGKMKETAEKFIGSEVKGAVITVPAYFNNAQRQATMNAGEIAGLKVLGIINEPTAAALAYGLSENIKGKRNILIYDLGGGTFDVSILKVQKGNDFHVLATTGNTHLGGGDFDNLIVRHLAAEFEEENGDNVLNNKKSLCKLKTTAEKAKQILSSRMSAQVDIDCLIDDLDLNTKITRACFENLCSDLFASTLVHVQKALDDAKMTRNNIDEVVLVGGSTRIPMVQQLLQEFFVGKSVKATINPDEAVAYGAAVHAAILTGDSTIKFSNVISDITALSLGVNVRGELMSVVIPRNTHIPCSISQRYFTIEDDQTSIYFKVLEGERTMTKDNHLLGSFRLADIPSAPAGVGQALVTFDLDANGILRVTAVEKVTGNSNSIVIQMKDKGLSEEQIEQMKADAVKYREQDEQEKQIAELRNQLERLHYKSTTQ